MEEFETTKDPRENLARTYVTEAIKNSHNSIKLCWTVMFTAGTVAALSTLNSVLRCKGYLLSSELINTGIKTICVPGFR